MTTSVEVIANQGTPYIWDNAKFQWDSPEGNKPWEGMYTNSYILNISETIAVSEITKNDIKKLNREAISISESKRAAIIKAIKEDLNIAEVYIDYITYILRIFEAINFNEVAFKNASVIKNEVLSIKDKANKNLDIYQTESLTISESAAKSIDILKQEDINFAEAVNKIIDLFKSEEFGIYEDKFYKDINQVNKEHVNFAESYVDYINYVLRFIEHINFEETPKKFVDIPIDEQIAMTDGFKTAVAIAISELLHVEESEKHVTNFKRLIKENINIVDDIAKEIGITYKEAIKIVEYYIRNANAVLSDISFSNGDLTLDDFKNTDVPIGFSPFKDFAPGEYTYKRALFKTIIEAGVTTGRPLLDRYGIGIDVPDAWDRGTIELEAIRTRVDFNRRFFDVPEVSVKVRAGLNAMPYFEADDTGFYIELRDPNDVTKLLAGTISWTASGY